MKFSIFAFIWFLGCIIITKEMQAVEAAHSLAFITGMAWGFAVWCVYVLIQ